MTTFLRLLVSLFLMAAAFPAAAQDVPPPSAKGPVYVVMFVDVAPAAMADTKTALAAYRDAARKEPANLGAMTFQDKGQANRFMVQEVWKEQADYDAHEKGAAAAQFLGKIKGALLGPVDIRVHRGFSLGAQNPAAAKAGLYVMIHLDVAPPFFAAMQKSLKPFTDASRKDDGVLRFDLLQHIAPRQNHITVLEAWASQAAFDAHQSAPETKTFREKLHPILGALYDQRLYTALN